MNNIQRNTAVFYTCGTCNLQCKYCGIHKSPVLKEIDSLLEESFKGDYYFNRVKEYFPRKDMLTSFETWGGEPFYHIERLFPLLNKLIEHYPYLKNGFSSTNFSYPSWCEKFFSLMEVFGTHKYRNFNYKLQLSVDGPEKINDRGRGQGVTKKCLNNFNNLVHFLSEGRLPKNITLEIVIKGTLDNISIYELNQKEKIIEYYTFFEDNFIEPIYNLNLPNVHINLGIPNTAVPSPTTKKDGERFAILVKNCREIEKENEQKNIFKFYKTITPFGMFSFDNKTTYKYGYNNCGTGSAVIGFLPNNMVSTCHEGFTQIVEKYTQLAASDNRELSSITFDKFLNEQAVSMCNNDEKYCQHCQKMQMFNNGNSSARLISDTALIMSLALSNQIDEKYLDEKEALEAAIFMQTCSPYCIKDNYNKTGSYILQPVGMFKLLLNGAREYIENKGEKND